MTISLTVPDILVAAPRAGDLDALEALYRAFETPVYNLALRILRSPEDAEDVLQETFLEVEEHRTVPRRGAPVGMDPADRRVEGPDANPAQPGARRRAARRGGGGRPRSRERGARADRSGARLRAVERSEERRVGKERTYRSGEDA